MHRLKKEASLEKGHELLWMSHVGPPVLCVNLSLAPEMYNLRTPAVRLSDIQSTTPAELRVRRSLR